MKRTLAIDPGTTHSGVVLWCPVEKRVHFTEQEFENQSLRDHFLGRAWEDCEVVCEWIQAMGMPVGKEVFDTCRFLGRLEEICWNHQQPFHLIFRSTVRARVCGNARAKDKNIRQALLDMLGPTGTKKNPGPLYGISGHSWSALAVAVAHHLT